MTAPSADTAEHDVVRPSVAPGPGAGALGFSTVVVPPPVVTRPPESPPAEASAQEAPAQEAPAQEAPPARGRAEHLAELRQARRQRRQVAAIGLLVMAGMLATTVVVLDVLH